MFENYTEAKLSKLTRTELINLCISENITIFVDDCLEETMRELIMYIKNCKYGKNNIKLEKNQMEILTLIAFHYLIDAKELKYNSLLNRIKKDIKEEVKKIVTDLRDYTNKNVEMDERILDAVSAIFAIKDEVNNELYCMAIKNDGRKCQNGASYYSDNKIYCGLHCKSEIKKVYHCQIIEENEQICYNKPSFFLNNKILCSDHKKNIKNIEFFKEGNIKKTYNNIQDIKIEDIEKQDLNNDNNEIKKSKRKNIPQSVRFACWNMYIGKDNANGLCYAGCKNTISIQNFHVGHIVAVKNNGDNNIKNLRPVCQMCNTSIGDMNMDEYINVFILSKKDPHNFQEKKLTENKHLLELKTNIENITKLRTSLFEFSGRIKSNLFEIIIPTEYYITENNKNFFKIKKIEIECKNFEQQYTSDISSLSIGSYQYGFIVKNNKAVVNNFHSQKFFIQNINDDRIYIHICSDISYYIGKEIECSIVFEY